MGIGGSCEPGMDGRDAHEDCFRTHISKHKPKIWAIAHHGDAMSDIMLYEKDVQTDIPVYQDLYGIIPTEVLAFSTFIISSI